MTTQQTTLEAIASQHLGTQTLTTRNSDSLDFYDVAVWSIEAALLAAFEAGRKTGLQQLQRRYQMSAAQADYKAKQAEAKALIKRLSEALEAHKARAATEPGNWGFAGDLGAFNCRLHEALGRVGGLTDAEKAQYEA